MALAYERMRAVLSAFSIDHARLDLSHVMRATGLPLSTAHRILEDLVAAGVLEKDEQKLYVIGSRLWDLGILSPRIYQQRTTIVPFLERLFLRTRQQTVLSTLHPNGAVVVEQLIGWREARTSAGLGERLPLHATSPGIVALAFGPPKLWRLLDGSAPARFTTSTITDDGALRSVVERARREGVAFTRREFVVDTASASAPIFSAPGELYGAISCVWDADADDAAINEAKVSQLLKSAANGASHALAEARNDVPRPVGKRRGLPRSATSPPDAR